MADHRTEFQKLQDSWDKALKAGIFQGAKTPPVPKVDVPTPTSPADVNYGMSPQMAAVAANSENINDADYWNTIFRLSRGEQVDDRPTGGRLDPRNDHPEVLTEQKLWPSKSPNPIPLWTKGMDQKYQPSHWFDTADLKTLSRMKEDLHAMGDKLARHDGLGETKQADAVLKKIKGLQIEIENLSNALTVPMEEKP